MPLGGTKQTDVIDCLACFGRGMVRTDKEAEIVLVGDIGHFGRDGSQRGDLWTWEAALAWADVILWGNHDRALVSQAHAFGGYTSPLPEVYEIIKEARWQGKLKLAHVSHGFLITHAGLHTVFHMQHAPPHVKNDAAEFATWINAVEDEDAPAHPAQRAVRDAVGFARGGPSHVGGILWRDIDEKLYPKFRQIFGHSADAKKHQIRYCGQFAHTRDFDYACKTFGELSYCIDIGGKGAVKEDNCLAGIWLPSEEIVRVDL